MSDDAGAACSGATCNHHFSPKPFVDEIGSNVIQHNGVGLGGRDWISSTNKKIEQTLYIVCTD